ncbi:MAG: cardiolipin synthase [Deltaproteobacteria bacterium GWB2_65_81]|nr:MAG: cardiolipin synthase [Deltaproteobacteria bacterium GWA2_65_63]OGP27365.1 MAG: cardiolipin synthase [Deltaproteobacteria bacterium GWB2_65_81]OGP39814.1 MAG: cardiolipin synthase [Deltaproteobacteria bacterium GWC2_66_88]
MLALDIAGYFFAFLLIPRIILERRHPSATLAWMLGIALLPLIGVPLYFLIGVRRIRRHIRAKIATVGPVASSLSHRLRPEELPSVLSTLCGRVLVAAGTPPPTEGNRVTFLRGGDEAYDAVLSLIGSARDHLHAQFFILDVDPVGRRFIQALAARAREGIRVRLLLDAVGSWRALRRTVRPLRDAGGEVAAFLPAFPLHRRWSAHLRNHRKLLIADGRKAFTGGMNIGKKYMGPKTAKEQWRDVAAVIEGPALPDLQALFLDDWAFSTEETLPAGVFFPAPVRFTAGEPPPCTLQVAASGPDRAARPIYEGVFAAFAAARRRLWIETPYFVPDDGIGAALRNAALRGVDVRLIVPGTSDLRIVSLAGRSYFDEMMAAGVRIFLYRATNLHTKLLVVDDDVGVIGSPNVDMRSFFLNFELGVFLYDRPQIEAMAAVFRGDLEKSEPVDPVRFARRSRSLQLLEDTCRIFSPLF